MTDPGVNMATPTYANMAFTPFANFRLLRGGWIQNPFADLCYTGKEDTSNPIRFIQSFEKMVQYEGIDEGDKLYYFGRCLKGTASTWYSLQCPISFQQAKDLFKKKFWRP